MLPSQIYIKSVKKFPTEAIGIDVGYVFSLLRIRESIVHEFISGDITIEDESNLYETLPIVGQEQIQITIRHNDTEELIVGVVYALKEFQKIDARRSSYKLFFVSIEKYFNQNNRVARAFTNTAPHEIITSIFKSDVPTKKGVIIESMSGNITYIAPNITPFKTIRSVLKQCESLANGTSNFLFFENRQGFIIASLASLLNQKVLYEYSYSEGLGSDSIQADSINRDPFTIEDFQVIKQTDTFSAITDGMFASQLRSIDLITREYGTNNEIYDYDYHTEFDTFAHLNSNPLYRKLVGISNNAEGRQYFSYTNERALDNDYVKANQSNMRVDFSSKTRLRNKIQRSMIDAYAFRLTIPGNILLYPSNIIHLNIASNVTGEGDMMLSGNVLVTSVTHVISGAERTYKQIVETTKDSHIGSHRSNKGRVDLKDDGFRRGFMR